MFLKTTVLTLEILEAFFGASNAKIKNVLFLMTFGILELNRRLEMVLEVSDTFNNSQVQ